MENAHAVYCDCELMTRTDFQCLSKEENDPETFTEKLQDSDT